jgi:hypothetical protein
MVESGGSGYEMRGKPGFAGGVLEDVLDAASVDREIDRPPMSDREFTGMCRRRAADRGDSQAGLFAVADMLAGIALQLKYLGTGNAGSTMGALEFVATHLGEKLDRLSGAINELGDTMPR